MDVRLCPRCRRDLLRPLALRRPLNPQELHRGASEGMLEEPDAEAEKVRRRKDRKRAKQYREAIAKGDWKSVATIHIQGKGFHEKSVSEDCPECLALVRGAA